MNNKIFAAFAAVIMVAVVGAAMVNVSDDSEAYVSSTVSHGEFDIYIQTSTTAGIPNNQELASVGTQWVEFGVEAYDACKAVIAFNQQLALSSQTYSINDTYNVYLSNQYGGYYDVDPDYGQIDEMLNLEGNGTSYWHAWVYTYTGIDEDTEETVWQWVKLSETAGMGHCRPFNDYSTASYQTANIALYFGTFTDANALTLPANPDQALVDVSAMKANNVTDYQVTITMVNKSVTHNVTILNSVTAYGSDLYAALKDACATNNITAPSGTDVAGAYYSWLNSIAGLSNTTVSPWTPYWASYDNSTDMNYFSYLLGFNSPLGCGYNYADEVYLEYV